MGNECLIYLPVKFALGTSNVGFDAQTIEECQNNQDVCYKYPFNSKICGILDSVPNSDFNSYKKYKGVRAFIITSSRNYYLFSSWLIGAQGVGVLELGREDSLSCAIVENVKNQQYADYFRMTSGCGTK